MKIGILTQAAINEGTGRKLIVAQDSRAGYFAIVDFGDDTRIGGQGATATEALGFLELELMLHSRPQS